MDEVGRREAHREGAHEDPGGPKREPELDDNAEGYSGPDPETDEPGTEDDEDQGV